MMLELSRVSAGYGAGDVLRDVSMTVQSGEIVTVIGANGAGKTTAMRVIAGLLHPRRGEVRFEGKRLNGLPSHEVALRGISLVPEGRRIFLGMTVEENLDIGALRGRLFRTHSQNFDSIYEIFPVLRERRTQTAGSLSGGEQQMLALGRALLTAPKLLLLDEPSLGLAPLVVRQIFKVIRGIHAEGTTILLVEQNANMALGVADRAYVLQTGKIAVEGACAELRDNPAVLAAYLGQSGEGGAPGA